MSMVYLSSAGTKIMEAGEDGYIMLPDGTRVTDLNGSPVLLLPGQSALVGPDGKALLDGNAEVSLMD